MISLVISSDSFVVRQNIFIFWLKLTNCLDKEIEILHSLALRILEHEQFLLSASELCGELDSLVALALGAREYGYNEPEITTRNIVQIRGGRHPLQELTVPAYIANSCTLAGGPGDEYEDEAGQYEDHSGIISTVKDS